MWRLRVPEGLHSRVGLVFTGNLASGVIGFGAFYLISRALSVADLGRYGVLVGLIIALGGLSDVGTDIRALTGAALLTARGEHGRSARFFRRLFRIQMLSALAIGAVAVLGGAWLARWLLKDPALAWLLWAVGLGTVATRLLNFVRDLHYSGERIIPPLRVQIGSDLMRLLAVSALAVVGRLDLSWAVWVFAVSPLLPACIELTARSRWLLFRTDLAGDQADISVWRESFLLMAVKSLNIASPHIGVWLLALWAGAERAGYFAFASRLNSIFPLLLVSFTWVVLPRLARENSLSGIRSGLSQSVRVSAIIAAMSIPIMFLSPWIFRLWGTRYLAAVPVFVLLLMASVFRLFAHQAQLALYAAGRYGLVAAVSAVGFAAVVLGMTGVALKGSLVGAGAVQLGVSAVVTAAVYSLVRGRLREPRQASALPAD